MCLRDLCLLYREIRYDTTAAIHIWRIFYFSPEGQRGDSVEPIIIKQAYMFIFLKLHRIAQITPWKEGTKEKQTRRK